MFNLYNTIIWGCKCNCGNDCFILQENVHPWNKSDQSFTIKCNKCQKEHTVTQEIARKYYSEKVLSYFENVSGKVLDIGCGYGFLSLSLLNINQNITEMTCLDSDYKCVDYLKGNNPNDKIKLINDTAENYLNANIKDKYDYIISRDVLMFIEDLDLFFKNIEINTTKGIKFMGWYMPEDNRVKNRVHPFDFLNYFNTSTWKINVEYLNWYKNGYFLEAEKRNK